MGSDLYLVITIVAVRFKSLRWYRDRAVAIGKLAEAALANPGSAVICLDLEVPRDEVDVTSDAAIQAWLDADDAFDPFGGA